MNRAVLALATCLLVSPTLLIAQPKSIRIKQGESIEYNVRAEIEVSETIAGGAEKLLRAETGGVAHLRARRVSRKKIEWSYETPEVKLIRVSSTMEPGEPDETTVQTKAGKILTDDRGRVTSTVATIPPTQSLASLMEAMHRSLVKTWFQPAIFRKLRPGDKWTEERNEHIQVDELGIDVQTSYSVDYTFDGIVDTLGVRALRVSWHAGQMSIEGTRVVDGIVSPVAGDGDHYGTSYFSTVDGLMLVSQSENSVDIRVRRADGVIPMTWRTRSRSIRR